MFYFEEGLRLCLWCPRKGCKEGSRGGKRGERRKVLHGGKTARCREDHLVVVLLDSLESFNPGRLLLFTLSGDQVNAARSHDLKRELWNRRRPHHPREDVYRTSWLRILLTKKSEKVRSRSKSEKKKERKRGITNTTGSKVGEVSGALSEFEDEPTAFPGLDRVALFCQEALFVEEILGALGTGEVLLLSGFCHH